MKSKIDIKKITQFINSTFAVCYRMGLVWRANLVPSLVSNAVNPLVFLFAFGFGLGSLLTEMQGMSYISFVVAGMIAHAVMYTATFESTVEAYWRFSMRGTWDAMLATPLSMHNILGGEILWIIAKVMLSIIPVTLIGYFIGGIESLWSMFFVAPMLILGAICFACCGFFFMSFGKSFMFFTYVFTFWMTPMYTFCGVFFSVERFPEYVQKITLLFPITHLLNIIRPLTSGNELAVSTLLISMTYLLALSAVTYYIAHKRLKNRLFD